MAYAVTRWSERADGVELIELRAVWFYLPAVSWGVGDPMGSYGILYAVSTKNHSVADTKPALPLAVTRGT